MLNKIKKLDLFLFPFVPPPPSSVGSYYLQLPDARAIFFNNDLPCNGTCSVTVGRITYGGARTENVQKNVYFCIFTDN